MEERLQKFMARCGVDSRRKCEELIARGQVEINGEVVREPGVKIDPVRDRVAVDGKRLRLEKPAYYLHYKVKGVTTTVSDDLGRKTVMDCLPDIGERVYPVGRLDRETEGLLVLTNDGAMAHHLTHPAHGIGKTYRVVAEGRIEGDVIAALAEKGMRLGPVLVKPSRVELVRYDNDNTVVLISVSEGINREVRRIFAALGHEVKKLLRIQVGPLSLAGMKRGQTRALTPREIKLVAKGMDGAPGAGEEAELFPPGSAKSRKPSGSRGRPRREKAPRRGKPDPAIAAPAKKAYPARAKVVEDDWKRKTGSKAKKRHTGGAPETAGRTDAAKPLRTLRPVKAKSAPRRPEPDKGKMNPAAKKTRPSGHPLTGRRGGAPDEPPRTDTRGRSGMSRPAKAKGAGRGRGKPAAAAGKPRPAGHPLGGRRGGRRQGNG